jgi:hypothetical protein
VTPPSRFGPNPHRDTVRQIEDVVEWVEAQTTPFTHSQAHRAVPWRSFNITYLTLRDLRDHGLIRRVSPPRTKPVRWIRADAPPTEHLEI